MSLKIGISFAALVCASGVAVSSAQAGAFMLREQSVYYQGMSYAGAASGNDLSSMFWNPAAAVAAEGLNVSSNLSTVIADSEMTASYANPAYLGAVGAESGGIGDPAFIPASYANLQLNERLFLGLAVNSQYGLTTKPDNTDWAGSALAIKSRIFSVNVNPNVAYKVTPEFTVAAGLQVQYFDVLLYNGPGFSTTPGRRLEADDIGLGATAGFTWKPAAGTQIGVGYRSAIKHDLEGTCSGASLTTYSTALGVPSPYCNTNGIPGAPAGTVAADIILPEMVTFGLRQELSPALALYGTVEWSNWSRISHSVAITNQSNGSDDVLSLAYKDGWFVSAGLEYKYSPSTTLRFGAGWEKSPTTDEDRTVMLPDNDRYWVSAGASYKFSDKLAVDLAYSHLFVDDAPITTSALGTPLLTAEGDTNIDIVSVGVKYKMGGSEPVLEPLK
jgi:long-chain fatty acid transport protein